MKWGRRVGVEFQVAGVYSDGSREASVGWRQPVWRRESTGDGDCWFGGNGVGRMASGMAVEAEEAGAGAVVVAGG